MNKRGMAFVLAGMLTLGAAAGCGGQKTAEQTDSNIISVVTKKADAEYWREVQAGALAAGSDLGYEVKVYGAEEETDVQAENALIMEAQEESAALVIAPADPNSLLVSIADLHTIGKPIVLVDSCIPDDNAYDAFIGTDNYQAAVMLGEYIAEQNPNAKVGIVRGQLDSETHDLRSKGLQDSLQKAGCTIVAIEAADSLRNKGAEVTETMLELNPDISVIVATNDDMILGAYDAVNKSGRQVELYGFDASTLGLEALIKGKLTACGAQDPIKMGYEAVCMADKIVRGEAVQKKSSTEYTVLDQEQAEGRLAEIQDVLERVGFD